MKTVKGQSKENNKNMGMPAKPKVKKGMGKGVKKPMKSPKSTVGY